MEEVLRCEEAVDGDWEWREMREEREWEFRGGRALECL